MPQNSPHRLFVDKIPSVKHFRFYDNVFLDCLYLYLIFLFVVRWLFRPKPYRQITVSFERDLPAGGIKG